MENKPQIPTLKESKKDDKKGAPPLRIKGLQSGQSLIERLKMFKKKDLAFILSGLGVLFMAPLAEHFMMSPNQDNGTMSEGWNTPGKGGSVFGNGSSPYEPGISGLAPGGAVGNGGDVITPLNVRDPSALVMGPGQTTQAPAVTSQPSAAPPPPPSSKDDSKWNDAIAAGKAAASAATKKAALPVPHIPLSAGGLRGLGAVSGGTGASFSLPAPSSQGLASGHVNQSNGLTGTSGSGFKGVARGPQTGGTGNLEQLKQAAAKAGSDFNGAGSATTALEQAASRDMGGGGGSDGGSGEGGGQGDKATAGSQNKDSKSPGESLDFLRQKMQMEKDIAFADELRKNDPSCLLSFNTPCMERNKIFSQGEETLINKGLVEPIATAFGKMITNAFTPDSNKALGCVNPDKTAKIVQGGDWAPCYGGSSSKDGGSALNGVSYCVDDSGNLFGVASGTIQQPSIASGCSSKGDAAVSQPRAVDSTDGVPSVDGGTNESLGSMCPTLSNASVIQTKSTVGGGTSHSTVQTGNEGAQLAAYHALLQDAIDLSAAEFVLTGQAADYNACKGFGAPNAALTQYIPHGKPDSVRGLLDANKNALQQDVGALRDLVISPDQSYQVKIFQGDSGESNAGTKLAQFLGDATKVNKADLKLQGEDPLKALGTAGNGMVQGDAKKAADSWKQLGTAQNSPWKDIDAGLKSVGQRLDAVAPVVANAQSNASAQAAADKKYTLQIGAGEGAKWQGVVTKQRGELGTLQSGLTQTTAALAPDGPVTLAHADAQVQLRVGGDGVPTTDAQKLVSMVGADGTTTDKQSFTGNVLDVVTQLENTPNMPADAATAATMQSDPNQATQKAQVQAAVTAAKAKVDQENQKAQTAEGAVSARVAAATNLLETIGGQIGPLPAQGSSKITLPNANTPAGPSAGAGQ